MTGILSKALLDPRLSWEAVGALLYLTSRPEGGVRLTDLLRPGTGRDRAYRLLRELRQAGYLERRALQGASGRFTEWSYALTPLTEIQEVEPTGYPGQPAVEQLGEFASPTAHPPLTEIQEVESSPLTEIQEVVTPIKVKLKKVKKANTVTNNEEQLEKHLTEKARTNRRRDGVGELARALGLTGWQTNFARVAVREERTRTAWYYLARRHPEVLRGSYRLLDKTGERGTVTWATWLPMLAEDVRAFGAGRVQEALEVAIAQATPRGCWGYYRARLGGRRAAPPPREGGYTWDDFYRDYGHLDAPQGVAHG